MTESFVKAATRTEAVARFALVAQGPYTVEHHAEVYDARSRPIADCNSDELTRPQQKATALMLSAAWDLDKAAGLAITALGFEQEKALNARDEAAYRQITEAKDALIAAQNKARGFDQPAMRDVTPAAAP